MREIEQVQQLHPQHQAWAQRHPDRAAEEITLRLHNREIVERFGHKVNGTPETYAHASRIRQGALARMFQAGDIDGEQLAAGVAIVATHAAITRDVAIGTTSLETRVDRTPRFDAVFYERLGAVRAEVTYSHWRREIAEPAMVLAIVVDDIGVSLAARRFRMRTVTAKKLLIDALDLWCAMEHETCKQIDRATLAAAQTGIM